MKKVIKLTESDLHGIIRKSVNKILREADINSDTEGLRDSLMQYIKNPVDIVKDVDYEPSDDEIIGALDDLDLDTDFSDLMGGQYDESRRMRDHRLTEGRLRRIVKESIKKVLRENELDYVPSASDYEGIEDDDFELDNYNGFYNYDNNGDYAPEFDEYGYDPSIMQDIDPDEISPDDLSVDADIAGVTESKKRLGRIIRESLKSVLTEKHRPSGVSKRIHTRDANGNKQSFDYIPNLPKYNKGQNFKQASKFQRINARPVEDPNGEDIDTVLKDGTIERKGLHLPKGYYNVNNVGGTEHWGIDPKTFAKKYEADPEQQGVYKPKGGPMLASDPIKRNLAFQAPWGGRMDMKKGSRILQDPNNPNDTYGIGGNEFDSTYKFDESKKRLERIVSESVRKVLSEMPVGKKINFNVDKRPVYKKFSTRARNPKFGLDRSSQRQMGMMYAQAMSEDRDDLAEKIWDYAHQKQEEASRINDEMYDILNNAFFQGEREFSNEDIWYDDDPQFN